MDTTVKEFFIRHGFLEDTNKKVLSGLFANNKKFKEVNISVYLTEPFMLLARSIERNVAVDVNSVRDNCLVLKSSGRYGKCRTVIMNILLDEINDCLVKNYGNGLSEFEFEVRGFRYSLHVLV